MSNASLPLQAFGEAGQVVACIDRSANAIEVARAASRLAQTYDWPLVLFHVLDTDADPLRRPDPLEWEFLRRQARRHLAGLSERVAAGTKRALVEVVEGERISEICKRAKAPGVVLVIGASAEGERPFAQGRTGLSVIEAGAGPALLVPLGQPSPDRRIGRIMVPLDGSGFSETALAEAMRLAQRVKAEIMLVHVVPNAGLNLFGPPDSNDFELREHLDQRNEQAACDFLERTGRRVADQGIEVRTCCMKGDTRSMLLRAIADKRPDLVILSTRGQGGRRCHDLPVGSTASYLIAHLAGPTMLVGSATVVDRRRRNASAAVRLPAALPSAAFAA